MKNDVLDEMGIPYIGSRSDTMKMLIDKAATHKRLRENGIPLPDQALVHPGEEVKDVAYPAIVKPCFESESTGISEESVVHNNNELKRRIQFIHETFLQPALVEEYLPGREITVAVIGNGQEREILPVVNIIDSSAFTHYPLVTVDLKVRDLITFEIPGVNLEESISLTRNITDILGCYDHIRVDLREDHTGRLKVIEVNGIPGLNPVKSRSLQIYKLYNQDISQSANFSKLINSIVDSALIRYGLAVVS